MRLFSLFFPSLPLDTILNILYCAYYCMQFVRTAQFKHKHLLALSTEDAEPRLVATSYAVRAYRSIETQNTSSHSRTGGLTSQPLRMQLVRTAQSKHKINLLALSTEDGGPCVVATWYVVLIVCSINSTAQFKHKHLLALSTEDGGPPGPRVQSPCNT